jgi:2-(1,2-epoxy-1,2-dihydrophenyl)acetyl-CoA isomerase
LSPDLLEQERHGSVLELRLNNPPYNGLTGPLLSAYVGALEAARRDDTVSVIVTTSAIDAWCVGGDLGDLAGRPSDRTLSDLLHQATGEGPSLSLADRQADRLGVGRYVLAIDAVEKPMVAAIGGPVAGGGLGLALLHDIRFASERALFTVAFTRLGLSLEMGLSYLLPRAVGPQAAFDLVATSRRVGPDEACDLGIVWRVVAHDDLVTSALAYAQQLAERASLGTQLAKRLLRRTWDHRLADQLEAEWPFQVAAFASPEARAAIEAFSRRAR